MLPGVEGSFSPDFGISLKEGLSPKNKRRVLRHELTHYLRIKQGKDPIPKNDLSRLTRIKAEVAASYGEQPRIRPKFIRKPIAAIKGTMQGIVRPSKPPGSDLPFGSIYEVFKAEEKALNAPSKMSKVLKVLKKLKK